MVGCDCVEVEGGKRDDEDCAQEDGEVLHKFYADLVEVVCRC